MIRIRYTNELQPGLNGHAERLDRTTVVYLLPGLTPDERAATLRRLRQHGRMGRGPVLPRWQLGLAVLADRVRMAFGQAGAIVRTHPAGSTLPVMAVSAAVAGFLLLSAVSIRIVHSPVVAAGAAHAASAASGEPGAQVPGARARGQHGSGRPGTAPAGSRAPAASGTGSGPGPGAPSPAPGSASTGPPARSGTTPPPSSPQSPVPTPAVSSVSPRSASPSAAASPVTSASSTTRVCVSIGPFGVCLGL